MNSYDAPIPIISIPDFSNMGRTILLAAFGWGLIAHL